MSSASQGRIYAYGNLSQTPALLGTFDTSAIGSIEAFGISDDGNTVIAGGSNPNPGSVYVINSGQSPRLIGSIQHPAAVQFLRNNGNAIVADDADNKVYQLTNGQLVVIGSANEGIATPTGIGISNDNQRVFVGNSASGAVTTLSLSGAAAQSLPCNCALTGLQATSADSVFAVTGFSGGPISLFDGGSATPRVIFVPARAQF
jgi:DNA-binding beta-propeller fold protein YncE